MIRVRHENESANHGLALHLPSNPLPALVDRCPAVLANMLLLGTVLSLPQPAAAQEAPAFVEVMKVPCRTYLAIHGRDVYPYITEPVVAFFDNLAGGRQAFGSACNIADYVRSECLLHPRFRLGEAIYTLVASKNSGWPLPQIPRCRL